MTWLLWAFLASQDPSRGTGFDQKLGETLTLEAVFSDESGRAGKFGELLAGKPAVLAFVYHRCPMLCSEILAGLRRSLAAVTLAAGSDFRVLVVSIDPLEDPERQRALKERAPAWTFLRGDGPAIAALAAAAGFRFRYDEATGEFVHPAGIVVVTPGGRNARYFMGVDYPPRDLRLALVEASNGRIGSLADRLLLLCFRYDPATGRYSLAVLRAVRWSGALVLLAGGGWILRSLWRERRRRRG